MYLRDVWAMALRRWYLVLLALLLTAAGCYGVANVVKPDYESAASVVLIPPKNVEEPRTNRYLELGGLDTSVDVLSRSMTSDETAKFLEAKAPGAEYEVVSDASTSAPIVAVTATAKERAKAQAMQAAVLERLPQNLTSLQSTLGITADNQITAVVISRDAEPETVQRTRIRVVGAAAAGILLVLMVLVAVIDGLLLRRSSSRRSAPAAADHADADSEGEVAVATGEPGPAGPAKGLPVPEDGDPPKDDARESGAGKAGSGTSGNDKNGTGKNGTSKKNGRVENGRAPAHAGHARRPEKVTAGSATGAGGSGEAGKGEE